MYVVTDRLTPAITGFASAMRARNMVLEHWPTADESGITVFDKLYYYQNGAVQESESHERMYAMLGIKVEDLKAEEYLGIDSCWIYMKRIDLDYEISKVDIGNYINTELPLVDTSSQWVTVDLVYTPASTDIPLTITDAEILAKVEASSPDIWFSHEDDHTCTAMAMLDTDELLFERTYSVVNRSITKKTSVHSTNNSNLTGYTARYLQSAQIEMRFRRIASHTDPLVDPLLAALKARIEVLDDLTGSDYYGSVTKLHALDAFEKTSRTSINAQLRLMYETITPATESNLNSAGGKIKYDGLANLSSPEFTSIFGTLIDTGTAKKKVKFWKRVISVVITIVAIVVSLLYPPSAGATWAAWAAYFATATIVLTIAQLAQVGLAMYWKSTGDYASAGYVGGTMQILGTISMVTGIASLYGAWRGAIAKEVITQKATEITADIVYEATKNMVVGAVKATTSSILNASIKAMNWMFQAYTELIDPPGKDLNELQEEVNRSSEELADTAGPDLKDQMDARIFHPYNNIFEMPDNMQSIYPLMTHQGKCTNLLTKYYS